MTTDLWSRLDSAPGDAAANMALDEALLEAMPRLNRPVLRFYGWSEPAASFGYFQRYAEVEPLTGLRPLVRRPTGGGLVPHAADWTYSLAIPTTHAWYSLPARESYQRLHRWLQAAFAQFRLTVELAPAAHKTHPGQCFAGHEQFDLLWHGRKLAGAAQRRRRDGLLIQGSVQPAPDLARGDWELAMTAAATAAWDLRWAAIELDAALAARANALAQGKYSQPAYNQKR